jgi:hypothetical protein
MESLLPDDAWVLGVDEHTVMIVDLDARTAVVTGRGCLTVRRRGVSRRFTAGEQFSLDTLLGAARGERSAPRREPAELPEGAGSPPLKAGASPAARSPLLAEVTRLAQAFDTALAARRAAEAAEAILHLDRTIKEWATDSLQSDEPDRARAVLHSLVHQLGEAAASGLRDPRDLLAPLVEGLIALRAELRAAQAWELADRVREQLTSALSGLRVKVNLIPMNPIDASPLVPPDLSRVLAFQKVLCDAGYSCFIRRRRGDEVAAACGQLALRGAAPKVRVNRA